MTHWTKLSRAHEHLDQIERIVERFVDMHPYRLISEYQPPRPFQSLIEKVRFRLILHAPLAPPPELAALVADCLSNLRHSLDHLIYGVALKHTGRIEIIDNYSLQFAIYDDQPRFNSWRGKVKGLLPDQVFAALERMQPYQGWNGVPQALPGYLQRNPLWILNALVNADKHRTISPVTSIRLRDLRLRRESDSEAITGYHVVGSYKHGETIAEDSFFPSASDSEMKMNPDFTADVAFDDQWPARGRPVTGLLNALRDHVRDEIFPVFEPFL